jgi:hypothetical protein
MASGAGVGSDSGVAAVGAAVSTVDVVTGGSEAAAGVGELMASGSGVGEAITSGGDDGAATSSDTAGAAEALDEGSVGGGSAVVLGVFSGKRSRSPGQIRFWFRNTGPSLPSLATPTFIANSSR